MKHSCTQETIRESSKLRSEEMNKKLNVTIKVLKNVDCKYSDTKIYFEENLKEKTQQWKRKLILSLSVLSE